MFCTFLFNTMFLSIFLVKFNIQWKHLENMKVAQLVKMKNIIEDDNEKSSFVQSHAPKIAWNYKKVCFIDKTIKEKLNSSSGYCLLMTLQVENTNG